MDICISKASMCMNNRQRNTVLCNTSCEDFKYLRDIPAMTYLSHWLCGHRTATPYDSNLGWFIMEFCEEGVQGCSAITLR